MGRRRIEVAKIEDKGRRMTTFTKRRKGLFKKAEELCNRCGAKVGIVAFSKAGNAFAFGHPSLDSVFDAYLAKVDPPPLPPSSVSGIGNVREGVGGVKKQEEEHALLNLEAEQSKQTEMVNVANLVAGGLPLELLDVDIDNLGWQELQQLKGAIEGLKRELLNLGH